jgi:hypothetical protein
MDYIISQAPPEISDEKILEIYNKNNEDVLNTLLELWNIAEVENKKIPNKFDEVREICDAYDKEMEKVMNGEIKLNNINIISN